MTLVSDIFVLSLISCYFRAKIQNRTTTNQKDYMDDFRASSSERNFSGPTPDVSRAREELSARRHTLFGDSEFVSQVADRLNCTTYCFHLISHCSHIFVCLSYFSLVKRTFHSSHQVPSPAIFSRVSRSHHKLP